MNGEKHQPIILSMGNEAVVTVMPTSKDLNALAEACRR